MCLGGLACLSHSLGKIVLWEVAGPNRMWVCEPNPKTGGKPSQLWPCAAPLLPLGPGTEGSTCRLLKAEMWRMFAV